MNVDRLPVFKALGDNTRYAIFLELARSPVPLSTGDIAEALDLHPNTVRPHLERMREVGLLEVDSGSRGAVGRPQHRYTLSADAPSLGLEPSAFRLLARLVADVAARARLDSDQVAEVGRDHGRASAVERMGGAAPGAKSRAGSGAEAAAESGMGSLAGSSMGSSTGASMGWAARSTSTGQDGCLAALVSELSELGFDPAVAGDARAITIAFTHCPFRELAEAFPDVVCHLHRGIVEGFVEARGLGVTRFATLADRNPCEVDLVGGRIA